jgi:hypothetical protein
MTFPFGYVSVLFIRAVQKKNKEDAKNKKAV